MSKNTRNRILLTALAALLLVTLTIGGTMAWLSATSAPVTNTFTASKVQVEIAETQDKDENKEESFKMVPGATISKEPKVALIAGSEAAWVFVKVTEVNNLTNYIDYAPTADWYSCGGNVWVYKTPLSATAEANSEYVSFMQSVTVKTDVDSADMKTAEESKPQLIFTPYAIQSDHLKITIEGQEIEIKAENIETYAAQVWALVGAN